MPHLFTKLLKSVARISTANSLEIIGKQLVPLMIKIFAQSDSEVQEEGVRAMVEISNPDTGVINQSTAAPMFLHIVESLFEVFEDEEPAKTAVLRILKQFAAPANQTEEEKKTI